MHCTMQRTAYCRTVHNASRLGLGLGLHTARCTWLGLGLGALTPWLGLGLGALTLMHHALQVEEAHAMAWAWVVARQLLLLFESDVVVARAALGCERATDAESDAATVIPGSRL